jgi:hypothetical protein
MTGARRLATHASLADVGNPKVEVAERAIRRGATAVDPEIDASVLSVCEVHL